MGFIGRYIAWFRGYGGAFSKGALAYMKCPNCGGPAPAGASNCGECGADLPEADAPSPGGSKTVVCPICDTENPESRTFVCPGCGRANLCLSHRVKNSGYDEAKGEYTTDYYCSACWKARGFETFSE